MVEPAFNRLKCGRGWTGSSIGQRDLNNKKHDFANNMFPGRWAFYTSYERCNYFYKEAQKVNACHTSNVPQLSLFVLHH